MKERTILITRAEGQNKDFRETLEKEGALVKTLPMIEYTTIEDFKETHNIFDQLDQFDWIVFTSATAVHFFFEAAHEFGVKFYFFSNLKIATVGEKTKLKLEQLGYRTNFVPIQYTAEVLAENMDEDIAGKKILIPRSNVASDEYLSVFKKRRAIPYPLTIYNNREVNHSPEEITQILNNGVDYLTFTSGSTFKAFHNCLNNTKVKLLNEKIICIGPSTAKVINELGYEVAAIANPHTIDGIVETIKELEEHV